MNANAEKYTPLTNPLPSTTVETDHHHILKDIETLIGTMEENQARQNENMMKNIENLLANMLASKEEKPSSIPKEIMNFFNSQMTAQNQSSSPAIPNDVMHFVTNQLGNKASSPALPTEILNFVNSQIKAEEVLVNNLDEASIPMEVTDFLNNQTPTKTEEPVLQSIPVQVQKIVEPPPPPPAIDPAEFIMEEVIKPNLKFSEEIEETFTPEQTTEFPNFTYNLEDDIDTDTEDEYLFEIQDSNRITFKSFVAPEIKKDPPHSSKVDNIPQTKSRQSSLEDKEDILMIITSSPVEPNMYTNLMRRNSVHLDTPPEIKDSPTSVPKTTPKLQRSQTISRIPISIHKKGRPVSKPLILSPTSTKKPVISSKIPVTEKRRRQSESNVTETSISEITTEGDITESEDLFSLNSSEHIDSLNPVDRRNSTVDNLEFKDAETVFSDIEDGSTIQSTVKLKEDEDYVQSEESVDQRVEFNDAELGREESVMHNNSAEINESQDSEEKDSGEAVLERKESDIQSKDIFQNIGESEENNSHENRQNFQSIEQSKEKITESVAPKNAIISIDSSGKSDSTSNLQIQDSQFVSQDLKDNTQKVPDGSQAENAFINTEDNAFETPNEVPEIPNEIPEIPNEVPVIPNEATKIQPNSIEYLEINETLPINESMTQNIEVVRSKSQGPPSPNESYEVSKHTDLAQASSIETKTLDKSENVKSSSNEGILVFKQPESITSEESELITPKETSVDESTSNKIAAEKSTTPDPQESISNSSIQSEEDSNQEVEHNSQNLVKTQNIKSELPNQEIGSSRESLNDSSSQTSIKSAHSIQLIEEFISVDQEQAITSTNLLEESQSVNVDALSKSASLGPETDASLLENISVLSEIPTSASDVIILINSENYRESSVFSVDGDEDYMTPPQSSPSRSITPMNARSQSTISDDRTSQQISEPIEFKLADPSKQNLSELVENTQKLIKQMKEEINFDIASYESDEYMGEEEFTDSDEWTDIDDDEEEDDYEDDAEEIEEEYSGSEEEEEEESDTENTKSLASSTKSLNSHNSHNDNDHVTEINDSIPGELLAMNEEAHLLEESVKTFVQEQMEAKEVPIEQESVENVDSKSLNGHEDDESEEEEIKESVDNKDSKSLNGQKLDEKSAEESSESEVEKEEVHEEVKTIQETIEPIEPEAIYENLSVSQVSEPLYANLAEAFSNPTEPLQQETPTIALEIEEPKSLDNKDAPKPQISKIPTSKAKSPIKQVKNPPKRSKSFSGPSSGPIGLSSVRAIREEIIFKQSQLAQKTVRSNAPKKVERKASITEAMAKFIPQPSTSSSYKQSSISPSKEVVPPKSHFKIPKKKYHETCFSDDQVTSSDEEEASPSPPRSLRKQSAPVFRTYKSLLSLQEPDIREPPEVSDFQKF